MKAIVLALGLIAWLPAARGESLDEALARAAKLEDEGRFAEVVRVLEPFGAEADGDVAFRLAQAHLFAAIEGVRIEDASAQDTGEARKWINRAIELGNPAAYQLLYTIYQEGFGVPADMDTAVDFLRLGVATGDPGAKTNFAILAYLGVPPVKKDVDLAAGYFRELAKSDPPNSVALYYLGIIQFRGQAGMAADEKAGLALIERAAEQGITDAERDMGKAHEFGWAGLEPDLRKALDWYGRAASHGDGYAFWRIGLSYVDDRVDSADPARAVDYFRKAAEAGDHNGMTSLGVMYATGAGVPLDFAQARHWYEQAVENGDVHALKNLAYMHLLGQGMPVDRVRAFVLASRSEQAGVEEATRVLALVMKQITPEELERARRQLAAEQDP